MRIYISGKITGLNYADVLKKFNDAQDLLESLGFEVINPLNNGLSQSHTWRQHIVRDIEMLLPCEAIYMLDNWIDSIGAGIEYDIALRTGKDVWFETNVVRNQEQAAIKLALKLANDKIEHPANDNELRELYSAIQGLKSLLHKSKGGISEIPNNHKKE